MCFPFKIINVGTILYSLVLYKTDQYTETLMFNPNYINSKFWSHNTITSLNSWEHFLY